MLLARLTLACAAGSHALAAQRLGPGISLPRDFAVYPRAALLDDFVETLDAATGAGLARVRATFGAPDLALAAAASGGAAAGRAGADADEAALRPVVTAVARAWRHGNVRVLSGAARGARTLGSAARAAARGAPPPAGGDLTVVVAPTCVEITIYGAFVLNQRDVLHAIDATPARWRGDAGSSPLDQARNGRVIECTRHC
jgi:hypothetical protein